MKIKVLLPLLLLMIVTGVSCVWANDELQQIIAAEDSSIVEEAEELLDAAAPDDFFADAAETDVPEGLEDNSEMAYEEEAFFSEEFSSEEFSSEELFSENGLDETELGIEDISSYSEEFDGTHPETESPEEMILAGSAEADIDLGDTDLYTYEDYIEKCFDLAGAGSKAVRGDRLKGCNKYFYDYLVQQIQSIAAGRRTSTEFDFDFAKIGPELGFRDTGYSASELGVRYILSNNIWNEDLLNALLNRYGLDLQAVMWALYFDYPFDLYWSHSGNPYAEYSYDASWVGNTQVSKITRIHIGIRVADEFQGGGIYKVNSKYGTTVTNAVSRANSIVSKYRSSSDYYKLSGYCKEIRDLTEYNHAAADQNNNWPYGNPWQLLWVFDGDPGTKVVCEGYAKAFLWLCDKSFFNDDIRCYMVLGDLGDESGFGGHAWNIVRMGDGGNYLVDVTNCRRNASGYPQSLFLTGAISGNVQNGYVVSNAGHNLEFIYSERTFAQYNYSELALALSDYHEKDEGKVLKQPTCYDPGKILYTCIICGATKTEEIPALDHDWLETGLIAPTCTEEGRRLFTCRRDSSHTGYITVAATGHKEEVIPAVTATCLSSGLTEGSRCSVCGVVIKPQNTTPKTEHIPVTTHTSHMKKWVKHCKIKGLAA